MALNLVEVEIAHSKRRIALFTDNQVALRALCNTRRVVRTVPIKINYRKADRPLAARRVN